jgi:hypothetical protein
MIFSQMAPKQQDNGSRHQQDDSDDARSSTHNADLGQGLQA